MQTQNERRKELAAIGNLKQNWDSYNADPPNQLAMYRMSLILDQLEIHQLEANTIVPSSEGVALLWFGVVNEDRTADIECSNNGSVTALTSDRKTVRVWWISDFPTDESNADPDDLQLTLEETLEHIRCFIWADYTH